jgi:uncharacterized protein (TIRG00374 family)
VKVCDALGWHFAFPRAPAPFGRLLGAFVAGQAVASTTPTGLVGSDAAMAWMLRDRVSLRDSVSSLIIAQTTSTASQGLFLLLGILLARWTLPPSLPLVRIMEWLLVLEAIGVAGFIAVQTRGVVTRCRGLLDRLGITRVARFRDAAAHVDDTLAAFYRERPGRVALSLAFNVLAWVASAGETWLILRFLGAGVSAPMAVVIEAFGTGISFATFFLPVQLGVDEGGAVLTFVALGLGGATGMSLALVRRVREIAWTGLGLVFLAGTPRPEPAALRPQEA